MQLEITDTSTRLYRLPFNGLRWSAIFAGLVVGIATNLLLMLLGASAGLAIFNVGEMSDNTLPVSVGIWNTISMVIAALAGGYVAARTAGMRRSTDGILHGVVAWGVTMVISAFLASSAAGAALGSFFGSPANRPAASQAAASIQQGDRDEAIRTLETRLGLSNDQAAKLVDQALVMSGHEESASAEGRAAAQRTMRTASIASGWLTAAILLSLLAAIGGGWLGARATHRLVKADLHRHYPPETPHSAMPS